MATTCDSFFALTAADLMTQEVVVLREKMPLREAARLLIQRGISGAPVVDDVGRCVGVLSTTDFVRLALRRDDVKNALRPAQPLGCGFQLKHREPSGQEVVLCTLPFGVCPIQRMQPTESGEERVVCREPHCVLTDWQVVELEKLPTDEVGQYMTPNPITVSASLSVRKLARLMMERHIHRVVVVDDVGGPIGIVTPMDILKAVAFGEDKDNSHV